MKSSFRRWEKMHFVLRMTWNAPPRKEVLVRAYGIGHHTESALNMKGFFVAVTHYNISTLLEERKERENEGDDED